MLMEISDIFRKVQYGRVTFHLSPEKKTLDYTVETTGKLPIDEQLNRPGMVLDKVYK